MIGSNPVLTIPFKRYKNFLIINLQQKLGLIYYNLLFIQTAFRQKKKFVKIIDFNQFYPILKILYNYGYFLSIKKSNKFLYLYFNYNSKTNLQLPITFNLCSSKFKQLNFRYKDLTKLFSSEIFILRNKYKFQTHFEALKIKQGGTLITLVY